MTRPGLSAARSLFGNAFSVLGTTAVTSGAGLVFWWLAARLLTPAEMGQGTTAVSLMTLLSTLGMLGLGTLLLGVLPKLPGDQGLRLLGGAIALCLFAGALLGAVGAVVMGWAVPTLTWLLTPQNTALLVLGVSVGAASLTFDQAVLGLLRGDLQFIRNSVMSVLRLPLLWGLAVTGASAWAVLGAWSVAALVSLGVLLPWRRRLRPVDSVLGALKPYLKPAAQHHLLNLAMQAPMLAIPVLAAGHLVAAEHAGFYLAWMVAGFLGMVPTALALVLPAVQPEDGGGQVRRSLRWSLWACLLGAAVLVAAAPTLLGVFGPGYREGAATLQLLALLALPGVVKAHYIALGRMADQGAAAVPHLTLARVARTVAAWGGAEVLAAHLGLVFGSRLGLDGALGLAGALLVVNLLEAFWMLPEVLRAASSPARVP